MSAAQIVVAHRYQARPVPEKLTNKRPCPVVRWKLTPGGWFACSGPAGWWRA